MAATGFCSHVQSAESVEKPNVILIMADDLGWEALGSYGSRAYQTPRLDKLAEEGVTFKHCFATPLCTPTRVMLMTGKYGHRNYRRFGYFPKEDEKKTIGNLMKDAGYATCMAGKWHVKGTTAKAMGFDSAMRAEAWGGYYGHEGIWINDKRLKPEEGKARFPDREYRPDMTVDFINEFIETNRDRPFFAYYPMYLVHHPEQPTPDSADLAAFKADPDAWKLHEGTFRDMVAYMDKLVGRIIDHVEELGIREKTIIMFTGDNGTCVHTIEIDGKPAGGGKGSLKDRGTRVPLVVSWKGKTPSGAFLDDLVDFTDFLPTLADIASVDPPEQWKPDGVSFFPQIKGEQGTPREWAFMHYRGRNEDRWPVTAGGYWARDSRWKLYDDGRLFDLSEVVDEKNPILPEDDTAKTAEIRKRLSNVFDKVEVSPDSVVTQAEEDAYKANKQKAKKRKRQ